MNDRDDAIEERANAAAAPRGWYDRLRREIERLVEAYNGDYYEVITAYRHQAQAAERRLKRLENQVLEAREDVQVAYYELRLASNIIDELMCQRRPPFDDPRSRPQRPEEGGQPPATTMRSEDGCPQTPEE